MKHVFVVYGGTTAADYTKMFFATALKGAADKILKEEGFKYNREFKTWKKETKYVDEWRRITKLKIEG